MGALKFIILVCLLPSTSIALVPEEKNWGVVAGSSGYQGEFFAGGIYRFNPRHTMALTLGSYTLGFVHYQLNVGYIYSPYEMKFDDGHILWSVADFGASLAFAIDHNHYFLKSPVQYPEETYYDQTRQRAAFQIGTTLSPFDGGVSIRYFVSLLTIGAIAYYNNREGYRQFLSSGISLKIPF